jgi:hypothetical protein
MRMERRVKWDQSSTGVELIESTVRENTVLERNPAALKFLMI